MSLENLRKKIQYYLRENTGVPLYVEYLRDRPGEEPFELGGKRWQFVNAKYPDGRQDIGVYAFGEDLVYHYELWRKMMGIDKENQGVGASNYDRHFRSDMKSKNENTDSTIGSKGDIELANVISYKPYAFILDKVMKDWGGNSDLYQSLLDVFAYDKFDYNKLVSVLKNYDVYDDYSYMLGLNENIMGEEEDNMDGYDAISDISDNELDFTDDIESDDKPDYDNDAFIQDVVSGGYDVSISGKHLGHYEDIDVALMNLKNEFNRSNFFPTIWFVNDHGNYWPIDEKGDEIKNDLNEISPELRNRTISTMKDRGQLKRADKWEQHHLNKDLENFKGKEIFQDCIIYSFRLDELHGRNVVYINYGTPREKEFNRIHGSITYDITLDDYSINHAIDRRSARTLSLIAKILNPNTKYASGGQGFQIKGMNENLNYNICSKHQTYDKDCSICNAGRNLNEDSERNEEMAKIIIQQLGGFGKLRAMTGAYNFVAQENGVSFKIKNPKANYIKVILNGKDLYDVEIGRIRGADYKVLVDEKDVYVENLKQLIEKSTGMYLSLYQENKLPNIKEMVSFHINRGEEKDLIPEKVIIAFYERIFELLRQGHNIQDEAIQQELNRLIKLNGKIPKEIQDLIDAPDDSQTSLT